MQLDETVTYVQPKWIHENFDSHSFSHVAYRIGIGRVRAFNNDYVVVEDMMMKHHVVKVQELTDHIIAHLNTY